MAVANCPFYGHSLHVLPRGFAPILLIGTHGNQCALVTTAHAPCKMEIDGEPIDWRSCPRVEEIRAAL